jgi:hypothetical protein
MLHACRKLTPEQYAAEPAPGWSAVRSTVYHLAVVTDVWLRTLAGDPDTSFPTEAEVPGVDDAERILERACRILDSFLPKLGREELATPRRFSRPEWTVVAPQIILPHDTCVEQGCEWLHYVCTEAALREVVAAWHRLTPDVREKIIEVARGKS